MSRHKGGAGPGQVHKARYGYEPRFEDDPFCDLRNEDLPDGKTLSGTLIGVRYHQKGWLIGQVDTDHGLVSIVGPAEVIQMHATYDLLGVWEVHERFGRQFKFTSYAINLPHEELALEAFLACNFDGVGHTLAKRIVALYGEETIERLGDPEAVAREVRGVTRELAESICDKLGSHRALIDAELELRRIVEGTGIGPRRIQAILTEWQHEAAEMIKEDPYRLRDFRGISWAIADTVARERLNFKSDDPRRIRAGLIHTLELEAKEGHTCRDLDVVIAEASRHLGLTPNEEQVHAAIKTGHIRMDLDQCYLPRLHAAESELADSLQMLSRAGASACSEIVTEGLFEDQIVAVEAVAEASVVVITGAPGVGKTHACLQVLETLKGKKVALCAPTGKAARRLSEQTGRPASTIHSLLRLMPGQEIGEQLEVDAVIVDEASMIDVSLGRSLFTALRPNSRLILVGDVDQLASVGPGSVLGDVIKSGIARVARLDTIKRQNPGRIITSCHAIRKGESIDITDDPESDLRFLHAADEDQAQQWLVGLVTHKLPALGYDPIKDVQVITATNKISKLSCQALNERLQAALNPDGGCEPELLARYKIKPEWVPFRVGDKVINLRNDSEKGLVNGDQGVVLSIDLARKKIEVVHDMGVVEHPLIGHDLRLAYCVTVHKAQGSEWPVVVIPLARCLPQRMLTRNWIYTAISRAAKLCVIVGEPALVNAAILRDQAHRNGRLLTRLRGNENV